MDKLDSLPADFPSPEKLERMKAEYLGVLAQYQAFWSTLPFLGGNGPGGEQVVQVLNLPKTAALTYFSRLEDDHWNKAALQRRRLGLLGAYQETLFQVASGGGLTAAAMARESKGGVYLSFLGTALPRYGIARGMISAYLSNLEPAYDQPLSLHTEHGNFPFQRFAESIGLEKQNGPEAALLGYQSSVPALRSKLGVSSESLGPPWYTGQELPFSSANNNRTFHGTLTVAFKGPTPYFLEVARALYEEDPRKALATLADQYSS